LRRNDPSVPAVFKQGDESDYDRIRQLNNRIKHFDEDIEKAVAQSTMIPVAPVWITNDGLEANRSREDWTRRGARADDGIVALRFDELADILTTQANDAKGFAEEFFVEAAERRKQQ
jgi:hypothetical protein